MRSIVATRVLVISGGHTHDGVSSASPSSRARVCAWLASRSLPGHSFVRPCLRATTCSSNPHNLFQADLQAAATFRCSQLELGEPLSYQVHALTPAQQRRLGEHRSIHEERKHNTLRRSLAIDEGEHLICDLIHNPQRVCIMNINTKNSFLADAGTRFVGPAPEVPYDEGDGVIARLSHSPCCAW